MDLAGMHKGGEESYRRQNTRGIQGDQDSRDREEALTHMLMQQKTLMGDYKLIKTDVAKWWMEYAKNIGGLIHRLQHTR